MSEGVRIERARIWGKRIEAQRQSGRTIKDFCEEHRLKRPTFFYWRKKFHQSSGKDLSVISLSSRFVAITRKTEASSKSPRIYLPNGVQIDLGGDMETEAVRQFLRSLCGVSPPPKEGHYAKP